MDWIKSLLFDTESIAHLLLLYSFVIAVGVMLGKLKFRGVSFGVAFILFTGIVVAHFGFTGNLKTIGFIQDFGLILFVYSLGLQVGPSFFTSFRKGGMRMNRLAVYMVLLNLAVAIGVYYLLFDRTDPDSFAMLVGVLSGAVTNTPGLGAAEEALRQTGNTGVEIASGYACAYPLAVLGVIMVPMIVKWICRIKDSEENEQLAGLEQVDTSQKPMRQYIEMQNERLDGKTIIELRRLINREFICSRLMHQGQVITPHRETVVNLGDQLCVVSSEDDAEAISTLLGSLVEVEWDKAKVLSPLYPDVLSLPRRNLTARLLVSCIWEAYMT